MPYSRRAYIVVTNARKAQANALAIEIDPTTSGDTFKAGLSPTGAPPATHWMCSWPMTEEEWLRAVDKVGNVQGVWLYDAALWTLAQVYADRGLQPVSSGRW